MAGPEQFTIEEIVSDSTWDGNNDEKMRTLEFRIAGESQSRKAIKPVSGFPNFPDDGPKAGGPIMGWLRDAGKFGLADKQDPASGGNGSAPSSGGPQGSPAGAERDYSRSPDHPLTEARMKHTACMGSAPAYIEQMLTIGVVDQPKDAVHYWELVGATIAKLKALYPQPEVPAEELPQEQMEAHDAGVPF